MVLILDYIIGNLQNHLTWLPHTRLRLQFPFQVEDVYNDLYDGYRKPENTNGNECGIIVNSVNTQHHGEWTCTVFVPGNSLVGSKQVVVTSKY